MICNFPLKSPDVVLLQGSLLALSPVQIRLAAARHFRTNSSSNSRASSCSNKQQKLTLKESLGIDGQLAPWVDITLPVKSQIYIKVYIT